MRTIHKFPLELTDLQVLDLSPDAEILSVKAQHEKIRLWALLDLRSAHDSAVYSYLRNRTSITK